MESGYNSCVIISDDEDDYVPFTWSTPTRVKVAEVHYSCYICKDLFLSEKDVDAHIKQTHPSIYKLYSFVGRKCLKCKGVFTSLTFIGLISHVVDRKCRIRMKRRRADRMKKKMALLGALSLVPVSEVLVPPQCQTMKPHNSSILQQHIKNVKKSHQRSEQALNKAICRVARLENLANENISPIDIGSVRSNSNSDRTPSKKSRLCTSFLCSTKDKSVTHPCESCQLIEGAALSSTRNQNNFSRIPLNTRIRKSSHHHHHDLSIDTNDLFIRAISASRPSAILANIKNCTKTMRRIKRQEKHDRKKKERENNHRLRGKLVLKIPKKLWNEVARQRELEET